MTLQENKRPVVLHARVVTGVGGGPEKTIFESPRHLEPAGFDAVCAYLHPPGDGGIETLRSRAEERGARFVSIPDRGPFDLNVVRELLAVCRRERVSIWHGHDYKTNALGLLLRRWWPMWLVSTVHGWVSRTARTWMYDKVDRLCLRSYDRVICVSPDLVEPCLNVGVAPQRLSLVENAIDLASCERTRDRATAKSALGVPTGRLVIGAVGRLAPEKGFEDLIRVVDRLLSDGVDVQLLIAGEGSERGRLEAIVGELGHGDRVRLLGHLDRPQALYEALDVFALSSLREGLPNVVLEAMGNRVPVVATRVAGIPRVLADGENGLIVEPQDRKGLHAALGRITSDCALRTRLGEAGRRTVEERYGFAGRMEQIVHYYRLLVRKAEREANRA